MKNIIKFFDKLEDGVRGRLSRHPLVYSLIGGVAIVLFWRGVWMIADQFAFMTGIVSLAVSVVILLMTGLFASFFVGDQIIISGIKREKKIVERTEEDIETEMTKLKSVEHELKKIESTLEEIHTTQIASDKGETGDVEKD